MPVESLRQIMAQQHDDRDGRHIHQEMNVMDQDQDRRRQCGEHDKYDGARRHQQQANREQAAVNVEMPERIHEVLQEERRAGHEHEQRQVLVVETEGSPEQCGEERSRDEPDAA